MASPFPGDSGWRKSFPFFPSLCAGSLLPGPCHVEQKERKKGREWGLGKECEKEECQRSWARLLPLPLLSKPASLHPPLCLFLTLFPRPAPVQKPSHLPQSTLLCLVMVLLPECRTAPPSFCLPPTPQSTCLAPTMGLAASCLCYVIIPQSVLVIPWHPHASDRPHLTWTGWAVATEFS